MPNFHYVLLLLGLPDRVYRSLIWAIHWPITQEEFLRLLTLRYFKSSLDGWSLTLNLRFKEGSNLSADIYADYESYFRLPLDIVEDDGTLQHPHELRLNSKNANKCWRWYSSGENDHFYFNSISDRMSGPDNSMSREEFFQKCYQIGIAN